MKLAILNVTDTQIKLGVNPNATEIINICNDLNEAGCDCTIINNPNNKHTNQQLSFVDLFGDSGLDILENKQEDEFKSINYTECNPNDFDAILFMNSHPNFFGGGKSIHTIAKFQWLAKSKKPIFYLFNDRGIPFEQLWPQICNRDWNDLKEEDVKITAPFYIISQFSDTKNVIELNNKYKNILDCKYIDFGTWILKNYENKFIENQNKYDLIYGGSFRGGRREKKFREFFFNKNIDVAIFGSMKLSNYKDQSNPPKFWLGKVDCNKVIEEDSLGFATIIVGEKGYNNCVNTLRQYESILAGCITFIDNDYDINHTIYPDNDFLYIKTGEELEYKINKLKTDKNLFEKCIISQRNFLARKAKTDYVNKTINYIKEKLSKEGF